MYIKLQYCKGHVKMHTTGNAFMNTVKTLFYEKYSYYKAYQIFALLLKLFVLVIYHQYVLIFFNM